MGFRYFDGEPPLRGGGLGLSAWGGGGIIRDIEFWLVVSFFFFFFFLPICMENEGGLFWSWLGLLRGYSSNGTKQKKKKKYLDGFKFVCICCPPNCIL